MNKSELNKLIKKEITNILNEAEVKPSPSGWYLVIQTPAINPIIAPDASNKKREKFITKDIARYTDNTTKQILGVEYKIEPIKVK